MMQEQKRQEWLRQLNEQMSEQRARSLYLIARALAHTLTRTLTLTLTRALSLTLTLREPKPHDNPRYKHEP